MSWNRSSSSGGVGSGLQDTAGSTFTLNSSILLQSSHSSASWSGCGLIYIDMIRCNIMNYKVMVTIYWFIHYRGHFSTEMFGYQQRAWKGRFPIPLSHSFYTRNPASRTSVITIPSFVFFPNPTSVLFPWLMIPVFWTVFLSNPGFHDIPFQTLLTRKFCHCYFLAH